MSTNPTMAALLAHRSGAWLRNANLSSGSATDLWLQRLQSVEPTGTHNSTDYFQLGAVDKSGNTLDPTTYRIVVEQNLHDSTLDMSLAGVNPTTGSGCNVGNMVSQTNTLYVVNRNDNDSVFLETAVGSMRVTEIQWRFVMNGACTEQVTLEGTSGSQYYTAGTFPHPLWGSFDNLTPGAVHGKDARIYFNATGDANKAYRLQSFTIRVQFPVQTVNEIGNRQLVGQLSDTPNVTVDFELNPADQQPNDVFFPESTDGGVSKLAMGQPQTKDVYINLFDPALAEGATVIKSWRLENLRPTSNTPVQARVRQLATSRWTLTNVSVDTANSGGVTISKTAAA